MYFIAIAFILGVLACALIIYISSLKETITRQKTQIQELEEQLHKLLGEQSDTDSVH